MTDDNPSRKVYYNIRQVLQFISIVAPSSPLVHSVYESAGCAITKYDKLMASTRKMYSLTVLGARSPRTWPQQGHPLS